MAEEKYELDSIMTYNTDLHNSFGGERRFLKQDYTFHEILFIAINMKAHVIVKPSRGKYWYIKAYNNKKTIEEIKLHLEENDKNNYKNKTITKLLIYKEV